MTQVPQAPQPTSVPMRLTHQRARASLARSAMRPKRRGYARGSRNQTADRCARFDERLALSFDDIDLARHVAFGVGSRPTSSSLLKLPEPGPSAHSLNNSDLAPSRRTFNSRCSAAWSSAEGAAVGFDPTNKCGQGTALNEEGENRN